MSEPMIEVKHHNGQFHAIRAGVTLYSGTLCEVREWLDLQESLKGSSLDVA